MPSPSPPRSGSDSRRDLNFKAERVVTRGRRTHAGQCGQEMLLPATASLVISFPNKIQRESPKGRPAMMSQEANDLITRTGAADPCGKLMRMYWQPAALVDELQGQRPVKAIKMLGEKLVLFRDEQDRYGLIERHCAHRGADLAFGRREQGGLRCAFHGWLFDGGGRCVGSPGEAVG